MYPSSNLAASLPSLSSLYPSSSLSSLPDVSTLLKAGQTRPFQDPFSLSGSLSGASLFPSSLTQPYQDPLRNPLNALSVSPLTSQLSGSSLFPSSLGGQLSNVNPYLSSPIMPVQREDRRSQLLQLLKVRSERIAMVQRYVEQGQAIVGKQQQDLTEWVAAEKQKAETQLALQKTALKNSEQELEALVSAQQTDVNELNAYNTAIKKAYVDSGLQLQQGRLANAKVDEAKQKDEYDRSMKLRKEIESQIATLTKEAGTSASTSSGAPTSASGAPTTTTAKPTTTTPSPTIE